MSRIDPDKPHEIASRSPILFSVKGRVIRGNRLGHRMGYPTANIEIHDESAFYSQTGVYAAWVLFQEKRYQGMANIGFRPTLSSPSFTIEVHIFDFNKNIYTSMITIQFLQRIRDELSLPDLKALMEKMQEDEVVIRTYFASLGDANANAQ